MNWREKITTDWPNDLQKAHKCRQALIDLDRALGELAGLGHPLHIEEGYQAPPAPGWPKAMFHISQPPKAIWCQGELDELGDGWFPTMEEARTAHGLVKQYERGGIFSRALPSMLHQTPQEVYRLEQEAYAEREARRKQVEELRLKNGPVFHGTIAMTPEALHQNGGGQDASEDREAAEVHGGRSGEGEEGGEDQDGDVRGEAAGNGRKAKRWLRQVKEGD